MVSNVAVRAATFATFRPLVAHLPCYYIPQVLQIFHSKVIDRSTTTLSHICLCCFFLMLDRRWGYRLRRAAAYHPVAAACIGYLCDIRPILVSSSFLWQLRPFRGVRVHGRLVRRWWAPWRCRRLLVSHKCPWINLLFTFLLTLFLVLNSPL